MTTNAVTMAKAKLEALNDQQIAKIKAEMDKKINDDNLKFKWADLEEAIRTNKVNELIKQQVANTGDRKADTEERKRIQDMVFGIIDYFIPSADAAISSAAKMFDQDISWHNKLHVAFDQATKLPFARRSGQRPFATGKWTGLSGDDAPQSNIALTFGQQGGLMILHYIPTIAISQDRQEVSDLQNTVRRVWTVVRSANSGAINNYDQSDLFQMLLASSNIPEIIQYYVRIFAYIDSEIRPLNTYDASKMAVLNALTGGHGEFWIENKPNIIEAINKQIRAFDALAIPVGFDLTKRRQYLNGKFIGHHDKNKSELYCFIPDVYYVYDEANAKLTANEFGTKLSSFMGTVNGITKVLRDMILPLQNGTATSIMAGDLLKAYGNKVVHPITELEFDFSGYHIFSDEEYVLESIRNANIFPMHIGEYEENGITMGTDVSNFNIKQAVNAATLDTFIYQGTLDTVNNTCYIDLGREYSYTDALGYNWCSAMNPDISAPQGNSKSGTNTIVLDSKNDEVQPDEIMMSTRFKAVSDISFVYARFGGGADDVWFYWRTLIRCCGSELIVGLEYCSYNSDSNYSSDNAAASGLSWLYGMNGYIWSTSYNAVAKSVGNARNVANNFHYMPFTQILAVREATYVGNNVSLNGVLQAIGRQGYNQRVLAHSDLAQLHEASFGSLVTAESASESLLKDLKSKK